MQRKGFTLVEIMIVVAIIGILIAIAVPGFLRAREISRRNACQENQSKIDGAVQQYILEERLAGVADLALPIAQPAPTDSAFLDWLTVDDATNPNLVGEDSYIRFAPVCPAGGTYTIDEPDDTIPFPVSCSLRTRTDTTNPNYLHLFPGEEIPTAAAPSDPGT